MQQMREQQEMTYKMIENIATSQNDLETNMYKAIMKIYNKLVEVNNSPVPKTSSASSKRRDTSPISFQHRSKLP